MGHERTPREEEREAERGKLASETIEERHAKEERAQKKKEGEEKGEGSRASGE
ncbi:hypothetical protein [Streptomyces sp. ODS28]|uniref:hypothetical protein n=1 Tax=Streptomyces sp. ODS28 TaxID=3136688 RepID=UPI0031E6148D